MAVEGSLKQEVKAIEVPEVKYRELKALNYSMIVKFSKSPAEFVDEFILGNPKDDDEDTASTLIGNAVDDILLTYKGDFDEFDNRFSEKYALYTGEDVGTKQVFVLANELFKVTKRSPDEDFKQRFIWAFDNVQKQGKYKGKKMDYALQDFDENALTYFQTKINNIGKMVISQGLLDKAKKIASQALTDDFTRNIYDWNLQEDSYVKLFKVPITFIYKTIDGEIEAKCEVDSMEIDHVRKEIIPMDTKTTYDNTLFPYSYLKNKYFIQNGWYTDGISDWKNVNGMNDYKVLPFQFNVFDTSGTGRRPLKYKTTEEMYKNAWKGFRIGGIDYKGIGELVRDIIWSNSSGNWGVGKSAFLNNGVIQMS